MNAPRWRKRFGARNATPHRPGVVDQFAACLLYKGKIRHHLYTDQIRSLRIVGGQVWFDGPGGMMRRSPRKAMEWLRNTEPAHDYLVRLMGNLHPVRLGIHDVLEGKP